MVVADDVLGEGHVGGTAGFQRDGVRAEMLQHVMHVGEPEVLYSTLASLGQRHAEVFSATLSSKIISTVW